MIVSLLVIFDNLGPLIRAVNPADRDAWLIASDRWLFGTDPTRALESIATPFLSDILTVCYALYYFHPIVLAGLLWADDFRLARIGPAREFPRFAFTILAVFYVSYAGYFAVPAIGPRYTIPHAAPLPRGAVSRAIDSTLDRLETNKRNCFPSGHTMVTVAVLIEGARRSRLTFLGFLPFAVGLLAATVYGRYHYVTDVLAGLVLVAATVPLARAAYGRVAAAVGTGRQTSR
jgi:membrane-associated phospholipid phosphatase